MNDLPIQSIEFTERKMTYQMAVWILLLSCLLTGGSLIVLGDIWKDQIGHFWVQIVMALAGIVCCVMADWLSEKFRYAGIVLLIPWPVMLFLSGFRGYLSGFIAWLNLLITRWNAVHEEDIMLLASNATQHDLWASTLMFALICGEIAGFIVCTRKIWLGSLYVLAWIAVQLFGGGFSGIACLLLIVGFFGVHISDKKLRMSERGLLWLIGIAAVLGICMIFTADSESASVAEARSRIENSIKTLRYGQPQLPEGDINKADRLKDDSNTETLMTVSSEQIKTMYFKSFSGGRYEDGCWKALSNADFGGEYAGMMQWLKSHNLDPMTQVSTYYGLSTDKPETNEVRVNIDKAFRRPVYIPASLESVSGQNIHENEDSGMFSNGLSGMHRYSLEEVSGGKPSELTVTESWLDNPETDAQTAYVEAEAVYRDFVYNHYLTMDETTEKLMQSMFWDEYDTENDGIYRAVCQIRSVLESQVNYTDSPEQAPEGEDPIRWFLTQSRSGNAVQYASAAVEAFRAHGIPARYAEGYYIADSDFAAADNGRAAVTQKNAHAWVEVYFDGIGWLPVEVTPGYYYDTVSLNQMINTSDVVRKTAALDDDTSKAQPMTSGGKEKSQSLSAPIVLARNIALVLLGVLLILVVLLVLIAAIMEVVRIYLIVRDKRALDGKPAEEVVDIVMSKIFFLLNLRGIHANLGWEAEKIDEELTERIPDVEAGDYVRVSNILEKSVYGGCELEPYEMRTLKYFFRQMVMTEKTADWKLKIKLRYAPLLWRWRKR